MKRERLVSIGLITGITITWILCALLVTWSLLNEERHTNDLGGMALERLLSAQRMQVATALNSIEQDLREETSYIAQADSLTEVELCTRWMPLLSSQWTLSSIALANEAGDEIELARQRDHWSCTSTANGSRDGLPQITEWPLLKRPSEASTRMGDASIDPRRTLWFGQALESHGPGPVWSVSTHPDSSESIHVSLLLRGDKAGEGYRIVSITVLPEVLANSLGPPSPERTTMLLNAAGKPWQMADTGAPDPGVEAALREWAANRSNEPFLVGDGANSSLARAMPFTRNGLNIYIGALVSMDRIKEWTRGDRIGMWSAAVLLVVLAFLMVLAFQRSRSRDLRAQRQERRNLTQERKLAKALGEREILDREVHHRVKNNLQVVSSLLNLQAERVQDMQARREFTRGKRRIDSMALVHHKLYMQQDLRAIDLQLFLGQVADAMKAMHEPHSRSVSHAVDAMGIRADADTTIQVGLILCELLSNCFQHAFPYVTGGHVDIQVRPMDGDMYKLIVKDNGKGLDRDPSTRDTELGLELVEALAGQVDGAVEVTVDAGTLAQVTFRMQGYAGMKTI